jgi:hypothetical protein
MSRTGVIIPRTHVCRSGEQTDRARTIFPRRQWLLGRWRAVFSAGARRRPEAWHRGSALHREPALLPRVAFPRVQRHDQSQPAGSQPAPWAGKWHVADDPESPSYGLDCRPMPGQTLRWPRADTTQELGTSSCYLRKQRSYAAFGPGNKARTRTDCQCAPLLNRQQASPLPIQRGNGVRLRGAAGAYEAIVCTIVEPASGPRISNGTRVTNQAQQ